MKPSTRSLLLSKRFWLCVLVACLVTGLFLTYQIMALDHGWWSLDLSGCPSLEVIIIALGIYLIPSMLAQGSDWFLGIFLVNLLFGWTVIGWLFCIVAAIFAPRPRSLHPIP